jgi:YD repeat-containing protein
MNKQLLHSIAMVSTATILFCSCQKDVQNKNADTELRGTPLPGQQTYCRIESIWENPGLRDERYVLFLYDEYENPTAITTPLILTNRPYHTFKYDSWHRLREYKGEYGVNGFEFWNFFGYDGYGRIAVDTQYSLGHVGPHGEIVSTLKWIRHYEYDNENRLTKVINDVEPGHTHSEEAYSYDASGNLIHQGVTYDNKVNIFRTNDIWMFLTRDYSVNNPVVADEYNAAGFPTKINSPGAPFSLSNAARLDNAQISYSCRQAYW